MRLISRTRLRGLRSELPLELQVAGELEVARSWTAGYASDLAEGGGSERSGRTAEGYVVPHIRCTGFKLEGQILVDDESLAQVCVNTIPGIWIAQEQRPRARRVANQILCSTGCGNVCGSLESSTIPVSFRGASGLTECVDAQIAGIVSANRTTVIPVDACGFVSVRRIQVWLGLALTRIRCRRAAAPGDCRRRPCSVGVDGRKLPTAK